MSAFLRNIPYAEKDYQERIVSILVSIGLGWNDDEIAQQVSLNLGSTQRVVPDIVLYIDRKPVAIIEVKSNHHKQEEKDILQLTSYMKQMEVNVGVYFGEKVVLYFKELGANNPIVEILETQLSLDDPNLKRFVSLFSRDTFNIEVLCSLYKDRLRTLKETKIASGYASVFISDKGSSLIEDALRNHLSKEGLEASVIERVLDQIQISIAPANQVPTALKPIETNSQVKSLFSEDNRKGKAIFSINGECEYGVGKLALAIVSMVSASNPSLAYEDLKKIFNSWRENIKRIDEIIVWKSKTKDKSKDTRWFEKYPIISNDGIAFAVTTQWGIFNIDNIISSGREHGLKIERIR
ncbi:MAG: type I restriction enzyme HsdR N-terminal domain-containing protein [Bacteroides sp.]|nr:type I restriction enzyme HsdR N-terminal domain-containing protein [Bacteroides sp.]